MFNVDTNVINSKLTGSNSSKFVGYRRFASTKLNGTTFWVPHVVLNPVPAQHNLLIFFSVHQIDVVVISSDEKIIRKGSVSRSNVENS